MPRTSRHKLSKHSSRDCSDSENDSSLKERKSKEESSSRVSKDSYRAVDDRWNGGEQVSRKSKSKRKEESEGKPKESTRKDRESGEKRDRETKGREGKTDRLFANEEDWNTKQLSEITESNTVDAEPDNQLERRIRRRRDGLGDGDGDKHLDDVGDARGRRFSSNDDISKDGKLKDEKHKDERYRDKYHEDSNWDSKHWDELPRKDHTSSRSDEKLLKDDTDMTENRQKKSKAQDHDSEHESVRDRDHVRDHYHDHQSKRDRGRDRVCNRNRDYYRGHDWDQDRDRERGRDRDRECNQDRDRETDRERERDYDHDGSYLDDRSARHKDSRGRKRSHDRDDCNDSKPRVVRGCYSDMEKKPLSSNIVESEAHKGRSKSRQVHVDSSSKRRSSPCSSSHAGTDEYRYFKSEESKYSDSVAEQRSKAISSRETDLLEVPERSSKYRSTDKSNKVDDGHLGELSAERSSSSKASPMGLVERSPSSTSVERRQMNRSGLRRSLDVEEPGRRSGASFADRLNRNVPLEKPLGDDPSQVDSSFNNRTSQSNSSSIPPLPGFRAGVGSPSYMGSLEDENIFNSIARYKRSGDPNFARGHGNAWRGIPSWSSPMPNGFMPFQHGPPLGSFQPMMPPFPSPPLFGVRPSMEINHAGIPYHIQDTDRFSSHLRPLGWQNMMDGSVPSHLHGWDGNNGVFRDEPHMYGVLDWDQNRHPMSKSWEISAETWKGQNGDVNRDLLSTSQKEDYPVHEMEDELSPGGQVAQTSQQKRNHVDIHVKDVETTHGYTSAIKNSQSQTEVTKEKMLDFSEKLRYNDVAKLSRAYLSKLDVSRDLVYQELYIQCMKLLNLEEEEATVVEDVTMYINLHGGRASSKTYLALHGPSSFPTSKDTVFQRAMDLYKKQRMDSRGVPIVSQTVLDEVAATNVERRDNHIPNHKEEKEEEHVLTSNVEPTDVSVSPSDQQIAGVPMGDMELVPSSDLEVQKHIWTPSPIKVEVPIEDRLPRENPEEPLPVSSFEIKDKLVVKSEAADTDSTHSGSILPACDETITTDGGHSACCAPSFEGSSS